MILNIMQPTTLDVEALRADFPILKRRVHGKTLAAVGATPSDAILDLLGREIHDSRLQRRWYFHRDTRVGGDTAGSHLQPQVIGCA